MTETLIPILNVIKRLRARRVTNIDYTEGWHRALYNPEHLDTKMRDLFMWIDKYTEGEFYLGRSTVAFALDKDFTLFKLMQKND